ncbi:hypothetical protein [Natronorubrum sulfidifaciens]|uniref:Uncharacterized protein n=1 Tax=Natronorubrum sulfidifaciens JCM 14089 TaxID=1230460 RepID=L9WA05_9EURY|nr:hypothetical protein [Natronorubrum sulfidifaciens]ELY46294.1 hypothetical protein C495_06968 [Natronorubrum sulfidifaciens JCM 14089]
MSGSWSEHVDELLFEGERERQRVALEAATVVVTNQRLLVFRNESGGSNYRHADRPTVTRVSVDVESEPRHLFWMTGLLFLGTGLLVVTTTTSLAAVVGGVSLEDGGLSGIAASVLEVVETLLTVFDLSLLAAAVGLVLVATVSFARYVRSRSRQLVIRISGDDDIAIPVTDADLEAGRPETLEEAIGPSPMAPAADAAPDGEPTADAEESG